MYIKRLIENTLINASNTFPVVILTGARQSGKTTILKHLFEKTHTYLSLDEMDIRMLAVNDPRAFLSRYKLPLIIDEIQNAPVLLSYIKAIVDKEKKHGLFIITGSQQFSVMLSYLTTKFLLDSTPSCQSKKWHIFGTNYKIKNIIMACIM